MECIPCDKWGNILKKPVSSEKGFKDSKIVCLESKKYTLPKDILHLYK